MAAVALDELKALFVGDWVHDDDRWETTPCYSVALAFEIAKRCDLPEQHRLRQLLYGDLPVDCVPAEALRAITLGAQRYRSHRSLQQTGRGL